MSAGKGQVLAQQALCTDPTAATAQAHNPPPAKPYSWPSGSPGARGCAAPRPQIHILWVGELSRPLSSPSKTHPHSHTKPEQDPHTSTHTKPEQDPHTSTHTKPEQDLHPHTLPARARATRTHTPSPSKAQTSAHTEPPRDHKARARPTHKHTHRARARFTPPHTASPSKSTHKHTLPAALQPRALGRSPGRPGTRHPPRLPRPPRSPPPPAPRSSATLGLRAPAGAPAAQPRLPPPGAGDCG